MTTHQRLEEVTDNVYMKLLTRVGTPLMIALLGWLVSSQMEQTKEAIGKIGDLSTAQSITNVKIDQLKSDLATKTANIYTSGDADKDWKAQAQRDAAQDSSMNRLQVLVDGNAQAIRQLEMKETSR